MNHAFNYTFADLLHIFYVLRVDPHSIRTYHDFAQEVHVSRRTVNGWFAGEYTPRQLDTVLRIAKALGLPPLQTDLLLFTVNPCWIRYGTPLEILTNIRVLRYWEDQQITPLLSLNDEMAPPDLTTIEMSWSVVFEDQFQSNFQSWGVGVKDDGVCRIHRSIHDHSYQLTLQNSIPDTAFMGGDSACFAPHTFYLTTRVRMIEGETDNDGPVLIFDEISDNCHAIFRIRERLQQASVVQTRDGRSHFTVYVDRVNVPALRVGDINTLALLAIGDHHWFYINRRFVGYANIARLPHARLDVGVAAGSNQTVTCHFYDFCVRVPGAYGEVIES